MSQVHVGLITPVPTEEEAVAIAAAATMLWSQPASVGSTDAPRSNAWRFSGRWWATDAISRRGRPGF